MVVRIRCGAGRSSLKTRQKTTRSNRPQFWATIDRTLKPLRAVEKPGKIARHLLWRDTGKNAGIEPVLLANPCPASLRLSARQKKKIEVSYFLL
jgi:hypothetical protein